MASQYQYYAYLPQPQPPPSTFIDSPAINTNPPTSTGTIFSEGVPDDIEPTHVLIGTGSYYTTTPHDQMVYIVAIVIGLVVVAVILLFAFGVYWSGESTRVITDPPDPIDYPPRPVALFGLAQGRGFSQTVSFHTKSDGTAINSEIICESTGTSRWSNISSECWCNTPYWGGSCQRESYKPQYIAAGTVTDETVTLAVLAEYDTNNLSYAQAGDTSCTDYCDADTTCMGVKWDSEGAGKGGHCTLFSQATLNAGQSIVFDPSVDANFYLTQHLTALRFTDRVLIYSGSLPTRWWIQPGVSTGLNESTSGFLLMNEGFRYNLAFFPLSVYNTTTLTGLFSIIPFDVADFATIVAGGNTDTYYINPPGQPLSLPLSWSMLPIWAMYGQA